MGNKNTTEKAIDHLSKHLAIEEKQLKILFHSIAQRFPYGSVPRNELSKVLNIADPTQAMVDSLYFMFDIDNDGVVSTTEYITTMLLYSKGSPQERVLL